MLRQLIRAGHEAATEKLGCFVLNPKMSFAQFRNWTILFAHSFGTGMVRIPIKSPMWPREKGLFGFQFGNSGQHNLSNPNFNTNINSIEPLLAKKLQIPEMGEKLCSSGIGLVPIWGPYISLVGEWYTN